MTFDVWFAFMLGAFSMWLVCMAVLAIMRFVIIPRQREASDD